MSIKLHDWLQRFHRDHEGGLSAEYVAVLIVIGAIVAALWAADIQGEVEECGEKTVKEVFNTETAENPC